MLSAVVLLSWSTPAGAQAISLAWEDCAASGTPTLTHDCADVPVDRLLFAAVQVGASLDEVIGANLVIDVQSAEASVPSWWQVGPGGCREARLIPEALPTAPSCSDAWGGQAAALLQGVAIPRPGGAPHQMRLLVATAVPSGSAVTLSPSNRYHLVRLRLRTDLATGPGSCPGCASGGCLVLNSVELVRLPGSKGGDLTIAQPDAPQGNWASWQTGASCSAVPVRPVSWGQIRALYR